MNSKNLCKKIVLLILSMALVLTLVACGEGDKVEEVGEEVGEEAEEAVEDKEAAEDKDEDGQITVTDIAGREVTIDGPVEKIVVNNRSAVDSLFAVGGEEVADKIVGLPGEGRGSEGFNKTYGEKYPQLLEVPAISAGKGEYDQEQIIALDPDVMILIGQEPGQGLDALDKVVDHGIPVVCLSYNIEPLQDRVKNLEIVGKVLGKEDRAEEISAFIGEQYDLVEEKISKLDKEKPVVHQVHFHGDTPKCFWSWGIITENAGGDDIANDVMGEKLENGGTLDNEYLLERDPEIITMGIDQLGLRGDEEEGQAYLQEMIASQPGWDQLSAYKNKEFYAISYSSALNLETFYANLQLAKWYYPEEFEDVDPDAILKEFYDKYMPFEYEGTWSTQLR